MKTNAVLAAMAAACFLFSAPVMASPVSGPSDAINWYALSPNGGYSLFESINLNHDGSATIFESGIGTFSVQASGSESIIVGSCNGCADVAVGLVEPSNIPGNPIIGDLFTSLTNSQGYQVFTFTSVDTGSIPIPADPFLPAGKGYGVFLLNEQPGPIDIAPYIFGLGGGGYILTIQSDVPEPATWALLAAALLGMIGMGAARRKPTTTA